MIGSPVAFAAERRDATRVPPPGSGDNPGTSVPAQVQAAATGGMPGWQIALIAIGAALAAASIAVLLDRAWMAHRRVSARAA